MHHHTVKNREQIQMIPLEQMVEPKSFVRIIDSFVDMLKMETFGFSYYKLNMEESPTM